MTAAALIATGDLALQDDLLRLAAAAGAEAEVAHTARQAVAGWRHLPLVLCGADLADAAAAEVPRRSGVVLVTTVDDPADPYRTAVEIGAQDVAVLPDHESWLVDAIAMAAEPADGLGVTICVTGGRGGAGASVLASGLGLAAARQGLRTLLIDGDPLGGGLDLVLGIEQSEGVRWPDLAGRRGRLSATYLREALPTYGDLALLSWHRPPATDLYTGGTPSPSTRTTTTTAGTRPTSAAAPGTRPMSPPAMSPPATSPPTTSPPTTSPPTATAPTATAPAATSDITTTTSATGFGFTSTGFTAPSDARREWSEDPPTATHEFTPSSARPADRYLPGAIHGQGPMTAISDAVAATQDTMAGAAHTTMLGAGPMVDPEAMTSLLAAATRGFDLVVVDVPRPPGPVGAVALRAADLTLLVVPAELRATLAADQVTTLLRRETGEVHLVVRLPAPGGLTPGMISEALDLPLVGVLPDDRRSAAALEEGDLAQAIKRAPLGDLCDRLVSAVVAGSVPTPMKGSAAA